MLALAKTSLVNQFHASLSTVNVCVAMCPGPIWLEPIVNFPFWHVAYHTLYYTDLYLTAEEASFRPRDFHRKDYNFLGAKPEPPFEQVLADVPYDKAVVLRYIRICKDKAVEAIAAETEESLAGPSGFDWYPIPRLELHMSSIRHIQHHASQLNTCVRRSTGEGVKWAGSGWQSP